MSCAAIRDNFAQASSDHQPRTRSPGDSTRRQPTSSVLPPKETPWRISAMISAVWEMVITERLKKRFPSLRPDWKSGRGG